MRKYLPFVVGSVLGVSGCSQITEREYYGHYRFGKGNEQNRVMIFTLDEPRVTKMIVTDVLKPKLGKKRVRTYEGRDSDPRKFDRIIVGSFEVVRDGDYTKREKEVLDFAEKESREICDLIDSSLGR